MKDFKEKIFEALMVGILFIASVAGLIFISNLPQPHEHDEIKEVCETRIDVEICDFYWVAPDGTILDEAPEFSSF